MAHQHFCPSAGHHWHCSSAECMCICALPMEQGSHAGCPIELRACRAHESGLSPTDLEDVREAGAVAIRFPTELLENLSRLTHYPNCVAYCIWCGFGYAEYSPRLEDEHFASRCPAAPEELRENAARRLHRSVT